MKNSLFAIAAFVGISFNVINAQDIKQAHSGHDPSCKECDAHSSPTASSPSAPLDRLKLRTGLVLDTFAFYNDSDSRDIDVAGLAGFGHGHHEDEHDHEGVDNGINLRHVELNLFATHGEFVEGWATLAVEDDDVEIEEAVLGINGCPEGFHLAVGKMYSKVGLHNPLHSHLWMFWDRPLVYSALLGDHGLNETGVRAEWDSPGSGFSAGIEAFQGENEKAFAVVEDESLPEKGGPRLWTGWLAYTAGFDSRQTLALKLSGATGYHQEEHDEDEDEVPDHWLHGRTALVGAGVDYTVAGTEKGGAGSFNLRGEYLYRRSLLEVRDHLIEPDVIGNNLEREQDGYYLQALYGIAPRWRIGLRWDEIGMRNVNHLPEGVTDSFGPSRRATASVDWKVNNASLLRFQVSRGDYETIERTDKNVTFVLQWQYVFGAHRH